MKKGDIIFVQGKGIISKMIRFVDKGDFSHVAIAVSENKVVEANVDTKVAIRPFDRSKYNVINVIDLGLNSYQRRMICESALRRIGTKYDYVQLFWYVLRKLFKLNGKNKLNNPNNMICSELVYITLDEARILEELRIKENIYNGVDLTPNELYDLVKYVSKK